MKNEDRDRSHSKEEEEEDEEEEVRAIFRSITLLDAKPTFCVPTTAPLCFLASAGKESQREPGHEWRLGGARAAGEKGAERAQRSPDKGLCSVLQRTRSKPQGGPALGPTLGVQKASFPRRQGTRATFVEQEQQAPSQNGLSCFRLG